MGHNFINVGEEYDGGNVYRGVNSAATVAGLGWRYVAFRRVYTGLSVIFFGLESRRRTCAVR